MMNVTLSFDNGPEPEITPQVLDVLDRRNIKTTFFVIGEKIADPERRALAQRAHAEGHWIGNHTFTHSVPLGRRSEPDVASTEIGRTQELLGDLAHPARLFRPFGGGGNLDDCLLNEDVVEFLRRGRYTCVLWNAIPRDWDDPDGWVDRAVQQCRSAPWILIVLHDLPTGAMRHLDRFLGTLGELGTQFRQDFPPQCLPIVRGEIAFPLDGYVSKQEAARGS
jgi:peptidoglycan/xylan/chitin deacetylase (PgdA/CDA1 family)